MNKIEQYIQDIIHREIQVKMDFHEPDLYEDSESFKEDGFIELPDDNHISYKFEWSYTRTKGMKGDGYLTPDDPDTLTLDYLDITELSFYDNETGEDIDLIKYPKLELLFMKCIINSLPVDEVDSNIYRKISSKENKRLELSSNKRLESKKIRLYNFDNFVMNEKKKSKSKKKVTGKVKWHGGTYLIHDDKKLTKTYINENIDNRIIENIVLKIRNQWIDMYGESEALENAMYGCCDNFSFDIIKELKSNNIDFDLLNSITYTKRGEEGAPLIKRKSYPMWYSKLPIDLDNKDYFGNFEFPFHEWVYIKGKHYDFIDYKGVNNVFDMFWIKQYFDWVKNNI